MVRSTPGRPGRLPGGRLWLLITLALAVAAAAGAVAVGVRAVAERVGTGRQAPGDAETDRIAQVVSDAISFPRQGSAEGFHRAALATRAAQDGRLQVLQADELRPDTGVDPLAHLVFRVAYVKENGPFGGPRRETITACYDAYFSAYGIVGRPERAPCPPGAEPAPPPPTTAPAPSLAPDAPERLRAGLEALPAADRQDPAAVRAAVEGLDLGATRISVGSYRGSVGVALRAGQDCLMGRIDGTGTVEVWTPPAITVAPGEASCDAATAAAPGATANPH